MKVKVLDCTLRDGGYCNQWKFGKDNMVNIISGLMDAGIEVIECGFISNKWEGSEDYSKFRTANEIDRIFNAKREDTLLVAMINYGEYDADCFSQTSLERSIVFLQKDPGERVSGFRPADGFLELYR